MIAVLNKLGKILTGDVGRILIVLLAAVAAGFVMAKGGIIMAALPMALAIVVVFPIFNFH